MASPSPLGSPAIIAVGKMERDSTKPTAPAGQHRDQYPAATYLENRLYFKMAYMARTPSFHPIFFPSSYVRPEYEIPTS